MVPAISSWSALRPRRRGREHLREALPRPGAFRVPARFAEIASKLEAQKAALAAAQARVDASGSKRKTALDALDADGLLAVANEAALALAEVEVAEHAIRELEAAHVGALAREKADALTARRDATERRVRAEAPKLLDEYDRLAAQMATVLAAKADLDREVKETNNALQSAGRRDEAVISIDRRYRFAAGPQEPDSVRIVDETQIKVGGEWVRAVQLLRQRDGTMGSEYGETRIEKREVRRPGKKRPDTWLPSLTEISLPAARIGGVRHWPRGAQ